MKNITLDFTASNSVANLAVDQPVAIMPAELAKKLLKMYASKLAASNNHHIIQTQIDILKDYRDNADLNGAINASLSWVIKRELIQNISNENWDAYKVEPMPDNGGIPLNQLHHDTTFS